VASRTGIAEHIALRATSNNQPISFAVGMIVEPRYALLWNIRLYVECDMGIAYVVVVNVRDAR
jgi:hypothetical protein